MHELTSLGYDEQKWKLKYNNVYRFNDWDIEHLKLELQKYTTNHHQQLYS